MDQPHMDGGVAQDCDDIPRIEKFRNDRRRADQLGDVRRLLRQIAIQNVLGLDDPDRGVGSLIEHHKAGVAAGGQRGSDGLQAVGQIDHAHLAARCHDGTDRKIAEAHDARDHLLFTGFEHAGILGFDHEGTDFILADFLSGRAAVTEHPQQGLARSIEKPDGG